MMRPNTSSRSGQYMQTIKTLKKENETMKKQMADQQKREQSLLNTIQKLEETVQESKAEFNAFKREVLEEFNSLKDQINSLSLASNGSPTTSNDTTNTTNNKNIKEEQASPSLVESGSEQEEPEDETMLSPSASPNHQPEGITETQPPSPSKRAMTTMIRENRKCIDQIDLRLQLQENTYYNGRILWRIDHFKSRRLQVMNGSINALHSAPSFTKPQHGYKFCLRMYPNGDGIGAGTHLSLFIVIMKSDYDCLLPWPFNNSVKFMLINQKDRSKDLVEKMTPHKNSASFQKPTKEMNIASGCPLFVQLDTMEKEGFLVDDTLFIEVAVEQG